MGIVPVDSNCRSPGEIFVNTCFVTARTGHQLGGLVKCDGERDVPTEGAREAEP
jgi:hypothetical protein